jgi:hypothetical protein
MFVPLRRPRYRGVKRKMTPNTYKISFSLLAIALLVFFKSSYYVVYLQNHDWSLSIVFTSFTALFNEPTCSAPCWQETGFNMYEEKAIQIVYISSIFLCCISFLITVIHSIRSGIHRLFLHNSLLSATIIFGICYVAYKTGVVYA